MYKENQQRDNHDCVKRHKLTTVRHSDECTPPPRHSKIGTVSLQTNDKYNQLPIIFPHLDFPNFIFTFHINPLLDYL